MPRRKGSRGEPRKKREEERRGEQRKEEEETLCVIEHRRGAMASTDQSRNSRLLEVRRTSDAVVGRFLDLGKWMIGGGLRDFGRCLERNCSGVVTQIHQICNTWSSTRMLQ